MFNKIKTFINDSFFMNNINGIIFLMLVLVVSSSAFCSSEIIGALSLCFSGLVIFNLIFGKKEEKFHLEIYEKAIIIYFLIVTVSLFGSTLFKLSLHGYLKTVIYTLFYFCCAIFFNKNHRIIKYIIL